MGILKKGENPKWPLKSAYLLFLNNFIARQARSICKMLFYMFANMKNSILPSVM